MNIKWSFLMVIFLFACQSTKQSQTEDPNTITAVQTSLEVESQADATFEIIGSINNSTYDLDYLNLFLVEGKDMFLIDSSKIENGNFELRLSNPEIGMYKMGVHRHDTKTFIINQSEKSLQANLTGSSFKNQMKISNSMENQIWTTYSIEKNKHNQRLTSYRRSKIPKSEKLQKIRAEEKKLKDYEERLSAENQETYAAKLIKIAQSPNRFNKDQYWNDVDFTDETLIHSSVLNDRIQDYMRNHGKGGLQGNDGFLNAVDFIYSKCNKNERVMNFMLFAMMEGFYSSNMTEVSSYIIENYIHGDACGTNVVSDLIKQKANGIRSLSVGQIPPDFTIANPKGELINFNEIAADNKHTLLFFWASWCHKCENEMPVLKRIYSNYSNKGFEIIGVSVDKEKGAWEKGIISKECNWINVSQLEEWQSPVAKDYRVNSTPIFFLVDEKRQLVLKSKRAADVENWLKQNSN